MKIVIAGGGAIGTSLGNILAGNIEHDVVLLTIEREVMESVQKQHINQKYFPNIKLQQRLHATMDSDVLHDADIIFLAIPSTVTVEYVEKIQNKIKPEAVLVNLAKGFGSENRTIAISLIDMVDNPVCSMKGPTFARELINGMPTAFTLASNRPDLYQQFCALFHDSTIHLDFSDDVLGVEMLSILKNIYAIAIGIIDAQFDSPNMRFMVLNMALNEMRTILKKFGGREETVFNYCGFGDFALTSLNDLSRNRTLGLLIGKGFFTANISKTLVVEGIVAVNIFYEKINANHSQPGDYPIICELYKVLNAPYDISGFLNNIIKKQ